MVMVMVMVMVILGLTKPITRPPKVMNDNTWNCIKLNPSSVLAKMSETLSRTRLSFSFKSVTADSDEVNLIANIAMASIRNRNDAMSLFCAISYYHCIMYASPIVISRLGLDIRYCIQSVDRNSVSHWTGHASLLVSRQSQWDSHSCEAKSLFLQMIIADGLLWNANEDIKARCPTSSLHWNNL